MKQSKIIRLEIMFKSMYLCSSRTIVINNCESYQEGNGTKNIFIDLLSIKDDLIVLANKC